MSGIKKNLLFIVILLTVALLCGCFFGKALTAFAAGEYSEVYSTANLGGQDRIFLVFAEKGENRVKTISRDDKKASVITPPFAVSSGKSLISGIFETVDGQLLVSVYTLDDGDVTALTLYRANSDFSGSTVLASYECASAVPAKKLTDYRFFGFHDVNGSVYYFGRNGGELSLYKLNYRDAGEQALVYTVSVSGNLHGAVVTDDGNALVALDGGKFMYIDIADSSVDYVTVPEFRTAEMYSTSGAVYAINALDNQLYSLSLTLNSSTKTENGALTVDFINQLPVKVNDKLYIPLEPIIKALGYKISADRIYNGYTFAADAIYTADGALELEDSVKEIGYQYAISNEALSRCFGYSLIWNDASNAGKWTLINESGADNSKLKSCSAALIPAGTSTLLGRYSDYSLSLDGTAKFDVNVKGDSLILTTDGKLVLSYNSGEVFDATSYTAPKRIPVVFIYIAVGLIILILSSFIHYVYCVRRKAYLPISLRQGIVAAVFALILLDGAMNYFVVPLLHAEHSDTVRKSAEELSAIESSGGKIENYYSGKSNIVGWTVFTDRGDGIFAVDKSNLGAEAGSLPYSAGGTDSFALTKLKEFSASEQGESGYYPLGGGIFDEVRYIKALDADGKFSGDILAVYVRNAADSGLEKLIFTLYAAANLCVLLVFIVTVLLGIRVARSVKLIGNGVDLVAGGEIDVELVLHTGDELETLGNAFNGAVKFLRDTFTNLKNLNSAYIRFVPQRLVKLLGESTVEKIDKKSHISKEMIAMSVYFEFGDSRYEHTTNELFDNINQIIEKISTIISRNNGVVYNFNSDGVEAVFEMSSSQAAAQAVSAAVQVRSELNQYSDDRETRGDNSVNVYIALDRGNVMLGIIGDSGRMLPTAISASLTTTRMLNRIGKSTDTGIICTENLLGEMSAYHSRYIGKASDGTGFIRIYEVYDGDRAGLIAAKDSCAAKFDEGIFAFYGRNFAESRDRFMEILKQYSKDGAARRYLYLSDLYSRSAPDDDDELLITGSGRKKV